MSDGDWPIIGNKFRGVPEALGGVLDLPSVTLITPEPVEEELLLKVHTPAFLSRERDAWYYDGALRTVGGCVAAAGCIAEGDLDNALVFSVAAMPVLMRHGGGRTSPAPVRP